MPERSAQITTRPGCGRRAGHLRHWPEIKGLAITRLWDIAELGGSPLRLYITQLDVMMRGSGW